MCLRPRAVIMDINADWLNDASCHNKMNQVHNFHVCQDCSNHHSRVRKVQKDILTHITEFLTHVGTRRHCWYSLTFPLDLRFSNNFIFIIERPAGLQNLYVRVLLTNADWIILVRKFLTHPTHAPRKSSLYIKQTTGLPKTCQKVILPVVVCLETCNADEHRLGRPPQSLQIELSKMYCRQPAPGCRFSKGTGTCCTTSYGPVGKPTFTCRLSTVHFGKF